MQHSPAAGGFFCGVKGNNIMTNDVVKLTKQLIKIPSYVREEINEVEIATFIFTFLQKQGLKPYKQYIDEKRFNVMVKKGTPKLWLCAHMDTVESKGKNDVVPKLKIDKLFGLGSVDMKGGLAAILTSVCLAKPKSIGLLFYCDEEYNFQGMKRFLNNFTEKPELVIIPESTNLQISNAHRGLIELNAIIKGKTGHASRPEEGTNAITQTVLAIDALAKELEINYSDPEVGTTTCTLSRIQGGLQVSQGNGNIIYAKGTNSIPNTAKIWLDIRPAVAQLRDRKIKQLVSSYIEMFGCSIADMEITEDLGALYTSKNTLQNVERIIQSKLGTVSYLPGRKMGYGDGQLFFEKTNSPVIYFGPGPSETCHKSGEYISILDLKKTVAVLQEVIKKYGN